MLRTADMARGFDACVDRVPGERSGAWLALAVVGFLCGCSTGGGSGGDSGPDGGALDAKGSFDDGDIHHLLSRTHFGVNPEEFAVVQQMGLSAYVDAMLEFSEVGTSHRGSISSGVEGHQPPCRHRVCAAPPWIPAA